MQINPVMLEEWKWEFTFSDCQLALYELLSKVRRYKYSNQSPLNVFSLERYIINLKESIVSNADFESGMFKIKID